MKARLREARSDGRKSGHVQRKLYGNVGVSPVRYARAGSCIGRKKCTGRKDLLGEELDEEGELH